MNQSQRLLDQGVSTPEEYKLDSSRIRQEFYDRDKDRIESGNNRAVFEFGFALGTQYGAGEMRDAYVELHGNAGAPDPRAN
jgi:hypothetical protein